MNNVWTRTTTAINFIPYTKQTSTRASTTNTGTTTQTQNTLCWDKWLGGYGSYPTTSNINNNAGYEGIELYNGSNKIMHWFSKKDTLHYYYTNGVQECDKNGGHRLNWVLVNGVWTRATTFVDFVPYTKQGSTSPTSPTEPTTSGTRPTTNTNAGTRTLTDSNGEQYTTGTGTYSNGEKYTYKEYLRADGTKKVNYYRVNGSLELVAHYRADGTTELIYGYRTDGTLESTGIYREDGTLDTIIRFRADRTIEQKKEYRADGTLERILYYRASTNTANRILEAISYYRTDETLERVVYYQADGETIEQTQYYRADKTKEKTIFANGVVWYYEADGTTRRNTGTQGNNNACILWVNSRNGRTYITSYTSISYATGLTLTQGGWSATRAAETMLAVERDNLGKYEYACFLKELRAITTYPNAWHELKKIRGGAVSEYQAWQRKYGIID